MSSPGFPHNTISHWVSVLVAVAICFVVRPSDAAFECGDESWEGASEFLALARSIAGPARVKLVAELDYGSLVPEDAIVFLHPEVSLDDSSLSAFVQQGGRAAILDDFGKSAAFSERFGISRVQAPMDPLHMLRGNANLPVGTPVEVSSPDGSKQRHPLVREVEQIVLNHPSALTNPGLTPVLELRSRSGATVPIAVTGVVGSTQSGRLLIMSDPSAFINLMIRYPGNHAFARAVVRYLCEDDGRSGKGRLFIVANRFAQSGRFAETQGPMSDALAAIERVLREFENGLPPPIAITIAALAALAIARWVSANLWRRSSYSIPKSLRPVPMVAQAGWPGRAAVLVSPTTHGALVLVELREALRARLTQLVALEPTASNHAILAAIENRALLSPALVESLRRVLSEVDAAERAVVTRKPLRVGKAKIAYLLHRSLDILDHLSQLERHHRESSPSSQ